MEVRAKRWIACCLLCIGNQCTASLNEASPEKGLSKPCVFPMKIAALHIPCGLLPQRNKAKANKAS